MSDSPDDMKDYRVYCTIQQAARAAALCGGYSSAYVLDGWIMVATKRDYGFLSQKVRQAEAEEAHQRLEASRK